MSGQPINPELLQLLVDDVPALVAVVDGAGLFTAVNRAWTSILGWQPEELIGESVATVIHPVDLKSAREKLDTGFTGEKTTGYINRVQAKDGSWRRFWWTAPGNKPPEGIAIGIDVTAEQEAKRAVERTRSRLSAFLTAAPGYITIVDRKLNIEYINRTYPGITVNQVLGTNLLNWMNPDWRDEMSDCLQRVFAGERVDDLVNVGTGEDGGVTWYRTSFGPLREGDEIVGATLYGEDISKVIRAEQARARAGRFDAVGRASVAIAHDLNNILTVVSGSTEMIAMDIGSSEANEDVQALERAVKQATDLTQNLMTLFRGGQRKAGPLALKQALRELEPVLRNATASGVRLIVNYPEHEIETILATHELSQLLINLVVNASEALGAGGLITVGLSGVQIDEGESRGLPPGHYAMIEVADDGPGIPAEIRERVFESFYTTKSTGSGIGLANCYDIVRGRMGDLDIVCPSSGGTSVQMWLPEAGAVHNAPATAFASLANERPAATGSSSNSSAPVVLIAEDDHATRKALVRYLNRSGHIVLEAQDGLDALEVAARHPTAIDVMVTDLDMPRLDGMGLSRTMRTSTPELPIIAMSGNAGTDQVSAFQAMGIVVVTKPLVPADLAKLIRSRCCKG